MKVNSAAAKRLARALVLGQDVRIPLRKTWQRKKVYLVPVHQIARMHWHYAQGLGSYKNMQKAATAQKRMGKSGIDVMRMSDINDMRKTIRKGEAHKIPPVWLNKLSQAQQLHYKGKRYGLHDGHHRLTAHQAEGKKFIRATFGEKRWTRHFY